MTKPSDTLARLRARSVEAGRFVLPLEPAWADKVNAAHSALRRAEMVVDRDDPDTVRRIEDARAVVNQFNAEAGDNVVVFRFRRLSRAQYDQLVSRHPATPAQREEDKTKPANERRVIDSATFAPELLASVLIDPVLTLEEATELLDGTLEGGLLSTNEAETLKNAAIAAALSTPPPLPQELALP